MTNIKTAIAATALAGAAAGALALGTGDAAADTGVPDGRYTASIVNPVLPLAAPPVASVPVTVRDGILTVAGLSGRLVPTDDGAKTVIAGQSVTLYGEGRSYTVAVNGAGWADLR